MCFSDLFQKIRTDWFYPEGRLYGLLQQPARSQMNEQTNLDGAQPQVYDLFISYSHHDLHLAERLSRRIRTYRAPRKLKQARRKLTVFRDKEQLTASPNLSQSLVERIDRSRKMALVASPSSAASNYVATEVSTFLERKGQDSLFVVLCRGELAGSVPPAVLGKTGEPLFIDLRNIGRRLLPSKRFRLESLRLIAALLGVDYSELRREDENRRRMRQVSAGVVIFAAILFFTTWGLIRSVPAETWNALAMPADHRGSRLMPIRDYAVNVKDPAVLLYEVFDANYANQKPKRPFSLQDKGNGFDLNSLSSRTKDFASRFRGDVSPLLTFTFEVQGNSSEDTTEARGAGRLLIYGVMLKESRLGFYYTLQFTGKTQSGESKQITIAPTIEAADAGRFEDWIVDGLKEFLPSAGIVHGKIDNHLDGRVVDLRYEIIDLNESFVEGNDGMWFQRAVMSNRSDLQIEWGGEKVGLQDVEMEDGLWNDLKNSADWSAHQAPSVKQFDLVDISKDHETLKALTHPKDLKLDPSLLPLLHSALEFEPDLVHDCTLIEKNESGRTLESISIRSSLFHEVSHASDTTTRYFLRTSSEGNWFEAHFSFKNTSTKIIDLFVEHPQGSLLVLTNGEGFYRSRDSGKTWEDFNFEETRLLDGTKLKVVNLVGTPALYALVDNNAGPDTQNANFLFSFGRRTGLQRLRTALIGLLESSSSVARQKNR
jgi:hypothetical protein